MSATNHPVRPTPFHAPFASIDGQMAELPLLLPQTQARALEAAARARGLSTGALVRLLVDDYLRRD
jgi:hypothetical protein